MNWHPLVPQPSPVTTNYSPVTIHGALILACLLSSPVAAAETEPSAERGRIALTTRTFTPSIWTMKGYEDAWQQWQPPLKEPPADYARSFADYYGLHPAQFSNGRLPMGLREGQSFLLRKPITHDCLLCHGGSLLGTSYVGLGNSALDLQAIFEDLGKASGTVAKTPFPFANVRGTTESASAAVYLLSYREPDLSLRLRQLDLGLSSNLCEDTPAWWLLKKKKTMYHTGTAHARSVRALMQFMLSPANSASDITREEGVFKDIQAYLFSLEAPKYPFAIDRELADKGHKLFAKTCSQCHGSYGADWSYPNKIVALDVIGTDPTRFHGISAKAGEYYSKSWFALEKSLDGYPELPLKGYQAPPLDGVWATAPYLHNGSVPTLYDMLNSKSRPRVFTRSFKTGEEDFDCLKVGWKVRVLDRGPDAGAPPHERRKVYDTTQPGRDNRGHTFGDKFTDEQRRAVVEYLKTL